jgi:hypothetical protein
MSIARLAAAHAKRQVAMARRTARETHQLWRRVEPTSIAASWRQLMPSALRLVATSQTMAAASASTYAGDVAEAYDLNGAAAGRLLPSAFAGVASDGGALADLLEQPAVAALRALGRGQTPARAMTAGALALDMVVRTQLADAGRVADGVAVTIRPQLTGYVRMLVGNTCSRCLILAGRRYEWNAGFRRHFRCDCRHVPVAEDVPGDLLTDPRKAFEAMPTAEQDKIFTKAGAQAIRDGADMSQVVNARRGAAGLTPAGARITADEAKLLRNGRDVGRLERQSVFGRDLFVTTEGTTTRGVAGARLGAKEDGFKTQRSRYRVARAPRLMPESIYEIADGDRELAVRLLRRNGFII